MKEPIRPGPAPKRPTKPNEPQSFEFYEIMREPYNSYICLRDLRKDGKSDKEIVDILIMAIEDAINIEYFIKELNESRLVKPKFKNVEDLYERSELFINEAAKKLENLDFWSYASNNKKFSLQDILNRVPKNIPISNVFMETDHYNDIVTVRFWCNKPKLYYPAELEEYKQQLDQYNIDLVNYKADKEIYKDKLKQYNVDKQIYDKLLKEKIQKMIEEGV